eukprot:4935104-Amphidinium_carterae.2
MKPKPFSKLKSFSWPWNGPSTVVGLPSGPHPRYVSSAPIRRCLVSYKAPQPHAVYLLESN